MAKYKMHGAFDSRAAADKKAKAVNGYVKKISVRGQVRYAVITKRKQ